MQKQNPPKITLSPEYLESQNLSSDFPERFWKYVNKKSSVPEFMPHLGPCWLWTGSDDGRDYGYIYRGKLRFRCIRTHVASWILNRGPIPKGLQVMHLCNVPLCVNPKHLRLGTHAENMRYMAECGRSTAGEKSPSAKLTEADVLEIRKLYLLGKRHGIQIELATQFGIDASHICRIVHNQYWKHLNKPST